VTARELKPGDVVELRSPAEVLSTHDPAASIDARHTWVVVRSAAAGTQWAVVFAPVGECGEGSVGLDRRGAARPQVLELGGGQPEGPTMSAVDDQLSTPEVRRRAVTGAVVDALRGVGIRLVGLLGTVVTARLLTPYDFGLVAIGTTVLSFGILLDDGGVGTALIRRPEPPTKSELQAVAAFQFGLDLLLVLGVGLVMLPFGLVGQVTTVIVVSLPLGAFRAAASIIYERRLEYRPMAIVEIAETGVFYVWAIVMISVGWGVWGLATAFVVRALAGTALLLAFLPEGRVAPVPSWTKVRPLLGFGVRFQGVNFLHMLRDQGVNIAVATFGGVAVLGLWGVAWRILQIPVSLFQALWRVSVPGMARLVEAGEDVGSTIERVIALVAVGTGVLVAPLAASASAWIHVLIGPQWASAASAIPPACFAMAFGVPISVALAGYLWAIGSASVPLRATAFGIPATLLLLLPLLPIIGVAAAGLAYIMSSLVESLFFVHAARRTTTFRIGSRLAIPVLLTTVSGSCGWLVEQWIGPDLAGALASSAVAIGVLVGGLAVVHRSDLVDAWTLIARGLRGVVATPANVRPHAQPEPKPVTG
jgi:O-antigen/teichoic acid export membrane protein